jgi:predicted nicotinamide N-methyase
MGPRMEPKEPKLIASVERNGNAQAIGILAAMEQFTTKSCARCAGLLLSDWFYDLENPEEHNIRVLRCVQCGHRVDPVIVYNHMRRPVLTDLAGRIWREPSVSRKLLKEPA